MVQLYPVSGRLELPHAFGASGYERTVVPAKSERPRLINKTFCHRDMATRKRKEGDHFTLEGEMLYLPPGQGISIYSLGNYIITILVYTPHMI